MERLLDIKTVPMSFEMKVQRAKLEVVSDESPSQTVTRDRGTFNITNKPQKLYIDTYETRSSMGLKSVFRASDEAAQDGIQAAYDYVGQIVEEGNALMEVQNGNSFATLEEDNYFQHVQESIETVMASIPSVPASINWDPQQLSIQYEADKLNFEWRTQNKVQMEFTPADVEFLVKEYAHVEVSYLGGPLYVPPSADPDYVPPKMDISA